ncbi:hypothetical protein D3C80_1969440 [compost metagenome]
MNLLDTALIEQLALPLHGLTGDKQGNNQDGNQGHADKGGDQFEANSHTSLCFIICIVREDLQT